MALKIWVVIGDKKPRQKLSTQGKSIHVLRRHGGEVSWVMTNLVSLGHSCRHPRQPMIQLPQITQRETQYIAGAAMR